ncbi:MAG: hypothetical protein ACOYB4_04045 [Methyloceanibacter sp.]
MRVTFLAYGLFALAMIQPSAHRAVDEDRAIPRYILHKDKWVCVDRNPRQLNRRDCLPRGLGAKLDR